MNLKGFLKQTTSWEQRVSENEWGDPTYASAVELQARVEEKQRRVLNAAGNEVLSETRIMLVDEVDVGDRLDGAEVQARESLVDIGGNTLGWICFL